jgi:hypothetical protein
VAKKKQKKAKAAKKRKTTATATTRSTAGPGFHFEDQVAAWLLLQALTGQELPGVNGSVTRLQMQVSALGWQHDDVLLTTDAGPDDARHLAISCKSNEQVSESQPAEITQLFFSQPLSRSGTMRPQEGTYLAYR